MRPRDAQRLLDVIGDLAPSSKVHGKKRDVAGEIWRALMANGEAKLAADILDLSSRMRELQIELKDEAWEEHELTIPIGKLPVPAHVLEPSLTGMSLTDAVDDRIVHVLLERNHGPRSGEITVDIPGDRTFGGTWSVGTAGPELGEASVLRLDINDLSNAEVAGIAQALVEGCPDLGADTFQYP